MGCNIDRDGFEMIKRGKGWKWWYRIKNGIPYSIYEYDDNSFAVASHGCWHAGSFDNWEDALSELGMEQ